MVTETIIGCSYEVANTLGRGFVEKVYANALAMELIRKQLRTKQQHPLKVYYKGQIVGNFIADILVENRILVETKATQSLNNLHFCQCLNYLKACDLRLCLLINFGSSSVQVRRVVNRF
jgi:GxxExxY protein